jgi:hypothetical protein
VVSKSNLVARMALLERVVDLVVEPVLAREQVHLEQLVLEQPVLERHR